MAAGTGGLTPAEVIVSEPNAKVLEKLKRQFPSVRSTPDAPWLLGQVEVVFVAVHPPAVADALKPLAGNLRDDAVVVSLAPRVSLARLATGLGGFARVARTIPNAPSLVGTGFNPAVSAPAWTRPAASANLLLRPGRVSRVPEDHLEAYAVLTAMGPTYLWFQLQQLRELGHRSAAPADVDAGLAAMVAEAARAFFASGLTPRR